MTGLSKVLYEPLNKEKSVYVCATEESNGVGVWLCKKDDVDIALQGFYMERPAGIEAATELAKKYGP